VSEHIVSPKVYIVIFASLMLGTGLTVWAAFQNFHQYNIVIALGIATIKATLVFSTSCTHATAPGAPSW